MRRLRSSTSSRHSSSSTGLQHRRARRAGQAVQLIERQPHRAQPAAEPLGQLVGERGVVAARAGEEVGDPVGQLVTLGRGSGRVHRELLASAHAGPPTRSGRAGSLCVASGNGPSRWPASLKERSIQRSGRLVLPLGQPGVRGAQLCAGGGVGDAEQQPHRRHDHPGVAHGHHRLAGVLARQPLERSAAPARGSCSSSRPPARRPGRARPPCRRSRSGRCTRPSPGRRPRRCGPRRGRSPDRRSRARDPGR